MVAKKKTVKAKKKVKKRSPAKAKPKAKPKVVKPKAKPLSKDYDVIIVGGGPGGSSCASFLGREGHKVLLVDKARFPRDKTCGDAISGKSLSVLKELGLTTEIEKKEHDKIYGLTFSSPNGTVVKIPMKNPERDYGYVSRRVIFDNILFQYAKKLVDTKEEFQVTEIVKTGEQVTGIKGKDLKTGEEMEFNCKVLVGADGAKSVVAQKLGLFSVDEDHNCVALRAYFKGVTGMDNTIELHFTETLLPGYFWIFPAGNGMVNVGLGMLTSDVKKRSVNLKQAMVDEISTNPLFKERFANAELASEVKGWNLPLGSKIRKSAGNGFVLVGDAASLIDPFSGEGMGNALTSGRIAFRTISKALRLGNFDESVLIEYDTEIRRELGPEMQTSYRMQKFGKSKFLLNLMIGKAAKSKELQEEIAGMLINEEAKKEMTSLWYYAKLLLS